ncbi:MAG: single-stranded-DNA-specific exonuclease RecJ [Thermoguttaceae bacterium]|nr:single-stranded-DNA-specific exonuclease RecJ [Thermoguttaceae bacterium]
MQRKFDTNWQIPLHDSGEVERMTRQLNIPVALAQILCSRKMTPEQGRRFLTSSFSEVEPPTALFGCEKAAELILKGIENNESFVIYGDYDVDGMSATVVLYRIITALGGGGKVNYYIPSRHDDGYGLHNHTVENLAKQGYDWLVTVDCGIRSLEEVALANQLGLKTIVTDHHPPREDGELPPALAVVHPAIPLNGKCTPELSGSAVAFKLAWQLCCEKMKSSNVGDRLRNILLELLGIATLGIVADVVPLTGDNRILTANGLKHLRNRAPIGVMALLQGLGLHEQPLSAENISYKIAPTLNAAGRVGDPNKAVELLLTIQPSKAQSLVSQLLEWNFKRKTLEQEISRQAEEMVKEKYLSEDENPFLVLAGQDWHEGVLGIVASRMVERFHRPTIILSIPTDNSEKPCSGSARSVEGFDVAAALAHCSDILTRHGGHKMAAGLSVKKNDIDVFRQKINEYAKEHKAELSTDEPEYVDAEVPLSALTMETLLAMEAMEPFGKENPRPTFMATNVGLYCAPRQLNSSGGVQFVFYQHGVTVNGVAFQHPSWASDFVNTGSQAFDIVFQPSINRFAGRTSVQLKLIDWQSRD